jgi:hypothetical protein
VKVDLLFVVNGMLCAPSVLAVVSAPSCHKYCPKKSVECEGREIRDHVGARSHAGRIQRLTTEETLLIYGYHSDRPRKSQKNYKRSIGML